METTVAKITAIARKRGGFAVRGQRAGRGRSGKAVVKSVSQSARGLRRVLVKVASHVIAGTAWWARAKAETAKGGCRGGRAGQKGARLSVSTISRESRHRLAAKVMARGGRLRAGTVRLTPVVTVRIGGSRAISSDDRA